MQPNVPAMGGGGVALMQQAQVALKLLTDVKATDSLVYFPVL